MKAGEVKVVPELRLFYRFVDETGNEVGEELMWRGAVEEVRDRGDMTVQFVASSALVPLLSPSPFKTIG